MKLFQVSNILMGLLLILGCSAASDKPEMADYATLQILHSNDILGYLTPCG